MKDDIEMNLNTYQHMQGLAQHRGGAWADVWHLWTVMIPRRSITDGLLWGKVWRRHDGRHWIYKRFVEFEVSKQ